MPDYDNTMKWWYFISDYLDKLVTFIPWILIVVLLFLIIKYPTQLQIIVAGIQRLFANVNSSISKKSIENELEGRVLKASQNLSKEIDEVLPYKLKIKWVKESNKKAFFDDNKVIICMDHNKTRNQNIVYAINDYVEYGLLPTVKLHIDDRIMKSSRLVLTRKLITLSYKKGLNYFFENIFLLETENEPEIKQKVEQLLRLDDSGMFVQILLREYLDKGHKYATGIIQENFQTETKDFLAFLYEIANREPGEINTLEYNGVYFKVGIILVASLTVYDLHGSNAYIKRFREKMKLGIDNIYLCSRSDVKVEITKKVSEEIQKEFAGLETPKVFYYNGRYKDCKDYKGVCIAFNNISDVYITKAKQQVL